MGGEGEAGRSRPKIVYDKHLTDLQQKRDEAQSKLDGIQTAGEQAWEDLKSGTEKAFADLKAGVERASSHFK